MNNENEYVDSDNKEEVKGAILYCNTSDDLYRILDIMNKKDNKILFRGMGDSSWELISTLGRDMKIQTKDLLIVANEKFLTIQKQYPNMSNLNILANLQHHGSKTPLIDFTSSIYNALWFACSGIGNLKEDAVIHWLEIKDYYYSNEIDFKNNKKTIYESPPGIARGISQKSFFILEGNSLLKETKKIKISKDMKIYILDFLVDRNISSKTIYPDIHGLSQEWETISPLYYANLGNKYYELEEYEEALKYYKKSLLMKGHNPEIYIKLMKTEMIIYLNSVQKTDIMMNTEKKYKDVFSKANKFKKEEKYHEALKIYDDALFKLKEDNKNYEEIVLLFEKIKILIILGERKDVLPIFREIDKICSGNSEERDIQIIKIYYYIYVDNHKEATSKFIELFSKDVTKQGLIDNKEYLNQMLEWTKKLKEDIEYEEKKEIYKEMIKSCNEEIKNDNKNIYLWINKADAHLRLNEYINAIETCDEGIKYNENNLELMTLKTNLLIRLNKYPEASKVISDIEKINNELLVKSLTINTLNSINLNKVKLRLNKRIEKSLK